MFFSFLFVFFQKNIDLNNKKRLTLPASISINEPVYPFFPRITINVFLDIHITQPEKDVATIMSLEKSVIVGDQAHHFSAIPTARYGRYMTFWGKDEHNFDQEW